MKIFSVNILLLLGWVVFFTFSGYGQNPGKHIRQGNKHFEDNDYAKAETSYLKALEIDTGYIAGRFNRADALYQQGNYEQAAKIFHSLTETALDENNKASVWHNLGNSFMEAKQYSQAVSSYKNALRNNPDDVDTKYNLTYALEKLKEQQQKQQQNKDKNQDQKDKNQDKEQNKEKNSDQNKNNKDQQDKQNKKSDQEKNDEKQKQPKNKDGEQKQQPEPRKISKNEARRMLQALKNNEKETLKKLKRIKAKGQEIDVEKDW